MRSTGDLRPLARATRWRRLALAARAILRQRAGALSWAGGRLAAGAILVVGVIGQALFGWRWWLVVIVLTVAAEAAAVCVTLARSAEREQLVDQLLLALAPRRHAAWRSRRQVARFGAAPFPLYGLPADWTGPRFLGGSATRRPRRSPERVTRLELGHGAALADHGPVLRVEVSGDDRGWPGLPTLADRLADRLGDAAGTAGTDTPVPRAPGNHPGAGNPGAWEAEGAGAWGSGAPGPVAGEAEGAVAVGRAEILVGGEMVGFDTLTTGRHWVGRARHGGLVLTLEGRDLPPERVRLVRVEDLGPYLPDRSGTGP